MKQPALTTPTQFAGIDNKTIAYRKFGTGAPIILANRFRGTLDTWDPLFLDLLALDHTVVIFDYAGIGYSEGALPLDIKEVASSVIKLADYLKFGLFSVLGWSYGGRVAQYVSFLNPERILKAVIIGSNPPGRNAIPFQPVFLERALKPVNDLEDYVILFYEPNSEKSRAAAKASHDRIMQRLEIAKIPASKEIFQRYFASSAAIQEDKEQFRAAYATIKTPVLVISGDNDISFAPENWYPLIKSAPSLQLIILPESGHAPHFQYPELVTGYIQNFLKNEY